MKTGFSSSLLYPIPLYEIFEYAGDSGFDGVDVCCWPRDEREWGGLPQIDVALLDEDKVAEIKSQLDSSGVEITALYYHSNPLHPEQDFASRAKNHMRAIITAAEQLGVSLVSFRVGMDFDKDWDHNYTIAKEFWTDLAKMAGDSGVRIALDNSPASFCNGPLRSSNMMCSPKVWSEFFDLVDSPQLGLDYDPSCLMAQFIDPVRPIYLFADKIFHVRIHDVVVNRSKLDWCGSTMPADEYVDQRMVGSGDIDFARLISALRTFDYSGTLSAYAPYNSEIDHTKKVVKASGNMIKHLVSLAR